MSRCANCERPPPWCVGCEWRRDGECRIPADFCVREVPAKPAAATTQATAAEAHFDALLAERRAKGRATYGRGLTHTDAFDWQQMALEEALDLAQYLAAENLRLREQIAAARRATEGVRAPADGGR